MALLSRLFIPVIAGLSLVTTTVSYAQQVGFKYKLGALVSYTSPTDGNLRGEVVEVGSCNEDVKTIDPDSNCHETHWYKVRIVILTSTNHTDEGDENIYTMTNKFEYVNQKNILKSIGVLHKQKKYD